MQWETVIGLEIHTQLATSSKIFSGAPTMYGAEPNTQACLVDLGYPGVLPVLNIEAVRMAVRFGLAIDAGIAPRSVFARKNYFYPDLPKGYQISQYELPIVGFGQLEITLEDDSKKTIGVTRAHLEEDAGKSVHDAFDGESGIDLNRAGTPLLEIVSEPDLRSAEEAVAYMRKIHQIVRYIGISDGNMQEGSFRCDANISVRPLGQKELGIRAELKNLNSFRFVERAINIEVERQIDILEDGGEVVQETRLYDSDHDRTRAMRSKEEANDYRYFPDPDLLPVEIDSATIDTLRSELPELPDAKQQRFVAEYGLKAADVRVLVASRSQADYFEVAARLLREAGGEVKMAANWVMGELSGALNRAGIGIEESPVTAQQLAALLVRIADHTISGKIAKEVFEAMWQGAGTADEIITSQGLKQISDSGELDKIIAQVIADCPEQVRQYRDGKTKVLGFLVGQVMKATQGKANPGQVNEILRSKL
ncbi:MAG TPA: Asp-tRNA(Asn)/Glu-tRNA(Gln) amidotransferase subunit GatB [Gammaproteobacteria bacterium]|jgi:aspartyl-tRNA(Asn)/glutamyl-tRNA(Gln) amidotransferase subunit B|nr:Asp-tRNA(Asn)/Glu-tRNA(Gln) amidotransferase GatCAB subunit B [Chromatiales bacterium]MCP4925696.1 Asp-tRNA(Asn)/Glu-tRNA(Gln) amidotransferase subunit GatB [Gammaproteobacteria bacterium]MDP7297468.1 Asp-tRNA(Asn)/Glu-tRNA(Gln) amidotransferase subunit GatB [Gammaproteobacteria bacterium]MDP7660153.1 Asp-tRNA(Asn)/Glu-tRNA(Gln) amidotransferase subunit GatB [Gammaproteobacteria bacterium]HJP37778.1 Asp-tRNA(Asn)/Glu-tRNA(Gln) amidotransferase subunit GatB [Gammaproteobacteria bacterium]